MKWISSYVVKSFIDSIRQCPKLVIISQCVIGRIFQKPYHKLHVYVNMFYSSACMYSRTILEVHVPRGSSPTLNNISIFFSSNILHSKEHKILRTTGFDFLKRGILNVGLAKLRSFCHVIHLHFNFIWINDVYLIQTIKDASHPKMYFFFFKSYGNITIMELLEHILFDIL